MGAVDDRMARVDPAGRVIGIEGLHDTELTNCAPTSDIPTTFKLAR